MSGISNILLSRGYRGYGSGCIVLIGVVVVSVAGFKVVCVPNVFFGVAGILWYGGF